MKERYIDIHGRTDTETDTQIDTKIDTQAVRRNVHNRNQRSGSICHKWDIGAEIF